MKPDSAAAKTKRRRAAWSRPDRLAALVILVLAFVGIGSAVKAQTAQQPTSAQTAALKIGIHNAPPFAMKDNDGSWYGLGVDLLGVVSRHSGVHYQFVETEPEGIVRDVASGKLDAGIGAVPINAADERIIDFSQPYYSGEVGVALRLVDQLGPKFLFRLLASPAFLYMLGLLTGPVFVFGALIWLIERRANPQQFEPRPARGVFSGIWWATVTMTTVGYGDKAPVTFLGRLLAMAWMFAALILASITTAQLAAGLTSSLNTNFVSGVADLSGLDVGTVSQSVAEAELSLISIPSKPFKTVSAGLEALANHDIDAFVYDRAALQWALKNYSDLYLTGLQFSRENFGLILPQGSPYREQVNVAILQALQTEQWHLTLERYLPNSGK